MRGTRRAIAMLALTLAGCGGQVLPASTPTSDAILLRLNSTSATLPLLTELTRAYTQIMPGVTFEIRALSFAAAVEETLSSDAVYFLTNHLPPPEQTSLWGAPIGQDGIAAIVHPEVTLEQLTSEQLRGIYQGRYTNWEQLGSRALDITVITQDEGSGTEAEFQRLIMGERATTPSAQIVPSSPAMITRVAQQPGSIGYVSLRYLSPQVRPLRLDGVAPTPANVQANRYPLRATLFFAGPGEPDGHLRAFIGWVQSPEGQAVVAQHYAPLTEP